MPEDQNIRINAEEASKLYLEYPSYWFLLKVLEKDSAGKATRMEIIGKHQNKDVLRDILLDMDVGNHNYIFMWADPEGKCEL